MLSIGDSARVHSYPIGSSDGSVNRLLKLRPLTPWQAFKRWQRNRHAVATLQALDERLLKDMGIARSKIESVVRGLGRDA
jgi:uncharacterized protein YjiS (DUF1127 family)